MLLIAGNFYFLNKDIKAGGRDGLMYGKVNDRVKLISLHGPCCIVEAKEKYPCNENDLSVIKILVNEKGKPISDFNKIEDI